MLTFEQFQKSREWHDEIPADIAGDSGPGFVYAGDLYIYAPGGGAAPSRYLLVIANSQKMSGDLDELERDLYDYGVHEGMLD